MEGRDRFDPCHLLHRRKGRDPLSTDAGIDPTLVHLVQDLDRGTKGLKCIDAPFPPCLDSNVNHRIVRDMEIRAREAPLERDGWRAPLRSEQAPPVR